MGLIFDAFLCRTLTRKPEEPTGPVDPPAGSGLVNPLLGIEEHSCRSEAVLLSTRCWHLPQAYVRCHPAKHGHESGTIIFNKMQWLNDSQMQEWPCLVFILLQAIQMRSAVN